MKKILLISLLLLVFFSCKDDEKDIVSPDREYTPRVIQETYGNAKLVGFVNDKNGSPLADVTVFFGEEKTTTGSDGSYQLNTLSAGANKRIWFEKDGYASTQKLADISEELPNRIDASLFPIGKTMKMTSDGGKIETENFSVEIEPAGFVYSDGTPVEVDVIVEATAFLTSEDEFLDAFPGEFRGTRTDGTTTAIESFGFIDVELKVETGEPVKMAEGVMATIKIKAPNNAPSTIPMWHYDEDKAKWIEEGTGTLNEGFYTANVTHFTKWNWDRPYDETSKIVGRVIDSEGNPIEGASVVQRGITYRFQNSTKTNEDGKFELLTPESNESEIEAKVEFYSSTIVNYTTSPTKGQINDMGDILIDVSIDNFMPPLISNDILYITLEQTAEIRGNYFGKEKRTGYKLLLNGNEIGTKSWENDLIEFDVPKGIPEEGTIQIDRDGMLSREVSYEEGDWTCEIDGVVYDNENLPLDYKTPSLEVKGKSLSEVPECIGNLDKLEKLDISYNQLTALPESIGNLYRLKELKLNLNRLNALPKSFGNLISLEELLLNSNELTSLPNSIGNLKNLEEFILDNNDLSSLPESIGNLQSLKELSIEKNQLTALPESIGYLRNLDHLDLSKNQLTSIPESITNLEELTGIFARNNRISSLPNQIGNLTELTGLFFGQNQINVLPESFCNLYNLRQTNLDNNRLEKIPENFGNLTKLEWLRLDNNQLTALPESFGNLTKIRELSLGYNNLTSIPESIRNLKDMVFLDLSYNKLTFLPESIKDLNDRLRNFRLEGNNFSEEEKAKVEEWLPDTHIYWE
jgi:Leucine-rich repeat (LRR) protein